MDQTPLRAARASLPALVIADVMRSKQLIEVSLRRSTMRRTAMVATFVAFAVVRPGVARADDVADVKAAEVAFNAAQNAGNIDGMFQYFLPGRTIYSPGGGALTVGWTAESKARRQADFAAGRKIDYRIEKLEVHVYGDTAVSTFERIGTVKELDGTTRNSHLRISGVWVRQEGHWKLAHRHESPF
jgi:ketosteroid isomerase-like protein